MKHLKKTFILLISCLILYPSLQSATIILTSDQQLNALLDPDTKIDMSTGFDKRYASLRDVCEVGQKRGDKILTIAFDEFFRQYRDQAGTVRLLTPDSDEYVEKIKVIADFAANYGMEMGLSLLSPLELGPAFKNQTGKTGQWLHYKVGLRDSKTGKFNVELWQQHYWTNNKGKFPIKLKGVKAYAFKEKRLGNSPYKAVDRDEIVELKDVNLDEWGSDSKQEMVTDMSAFHPEINENEPDNKRVTVYSNGSDEYKGYDNVLVVLEYDVPEIEYFSAEAAPFLEELLKKYHDNGIKVRHFYSDEMHIQQDWKYFGHHDNGQLALRYYTDALGEMYTKMYGVPFEQKDILYFVYGPDINSNNADAVTNVQYVKGETVEDIQSTFLFRDRYYKMLNNHVVDLFKNAKEYASKLFGVDDFGTFGHSSWAQSPTIDLWNVGQLNGNSYKYEYTPNFIWGNTVHQAAAACYDYFKWGEYLEPTRNDFAEGGWNDRNYYGAAMSTSIGVLNKFPYSYPAFWGMPHDVGRRKAAINDAFGGAAESKSLRLITQSVHRDVDVLILYPMNLVALEERFGSWITQYGYANFITAEKLLELGEFTDEGEIKIKEKKYSTLIALFEPIPQKGVLDIMGKLAKKGGRSIWFGPPPLISGAGEKCLSKWESIFNVKYSPTIYQGQIAAGKKIKFKNQLREIPEQYILTDFIIDRIYPVESNSGTSELAFCDNNLLVGTNFNNAYYFGFRPRDDQSASLGYETRTLFEILDKIGAYSSTGSFIDVNDNTEHISRTTDYLATRFPNNTTVLVRHYRNHRENWPGGFSRNTEEDKRFLAQNPLPTDSINITEFKVNGHNITYKGSLSMAFRMDDNNELIAFDGENCNQVDIDGREYIFANKPLGKIAFAPSDEDNSNEIKLFVRGKTMVSIPLPSEFHVGKIYLLGPDGKNIKFEKVENMIRFNVIDNLNSKWLTIKKVK